MLIHHVLYIKLRVYAYGSGSSNVLAHFEQIQTNHRQSLKCCAVMLLCWNFQILLIQIKCFHEIITIGYSVYKSHDLPWFRTLSWFFLVSSNYFFYGESMMQYFGVLMSRTVCSLTFSYSVHEITSTLRLSDSILLVIIIWILWLCIGNFSFVLCDCS